MARDVGQHLLEDAKHRDGQPTLGRRHLGRDHHAEVDPALVGTGSLKLLRLPFQRRPQALVIKDAWAQVGDDAAHRVHRGVHQAAHVAALVAQGLAVYRLAHTPGHPGRSIFSATSRLPSSSWISRAMRLRSVSRTSSRCADRSRSWAVRSATRSSSSSRLRRNSASACLRTEMSVNVITAPCTWPPSSTGWLEYSVGNALPSARQNTSSSWRHGWPRLKAR